MATMAQKVAVTRALNEMYTGYPRVNQGELVRRTMESMEVSGVDKLIVPEDQIPQPPPDPKLIEAESKMMLVKPQVDESAMKMEKMSEELKEIQVRTVQMIKDWEQSQENAIIQLEQEQEKLQGLRLDNQQKMLDLKKTDEEIRKIIQEILDMRENDGSSETS